MRVISRLVWAGLLVLCAAAPLAAADTAVDFHGFQWGTGMEAFIAAMGAPVSREETGGLVSLAYADIEVGGYKTFMIAYFSGTGLEGGTYYFLTRDLDDLMKCYTETQRRLLAQYGPTTLRDGIIRERRPYETSWNLAGGYVYLKVNTRLGEPVTLWYSSPALTKQLLGS